jgi:hypothetical protein
MTETNFRALCAELVALDGHCVVDCTEEWADAMCRLRAALAQPEPVAPTDEELLELMPQQMRDDLANAARALAGFDRANVKSAGAMRIILNRQAANHARAVLAKWGTPANNTRGTH